jgi:general secretion pathway protein I
VIRKLSKLNGIQRGFSLLEILVAFSILSVLLGVLINIFSTGVRTAQLTGDYARAIQIAESLLTTASTEKTFQEDERYGVIDDTYTWTIKIEPFVPEDVEWNEELSSLLPYRIQVDVGWADRINERTVRLVTLRLTEKNETQ